MLYIYSRKLKLFKETCSLVSHMSQVGFDIHMKYKNAKRISCHFLFKVLARHVCYILYCKWCRLNSRILKQWDNIFRIFVILKLLHSFRWGRFSLFLVPSIHSYVHYGHCFVSPIFYRMFMIMQVVVSALAGQ